MELVSASTLLPHVGIGDDYVKNGGKVTADSNGGFLAGDDHE